MTYCLAIKVEQGLIFASDSRTNAGVDQISTYSKMHTFEGKNGPAVCVLTAGNLATSQAVLRQVRQDIDSKSRHSLFRIKNISEAADYIGSLSRAEQSKYESANPDFNADSTFIVGGQVGTHPPQLFMVYPEGNYIEARAQTPYLQIGELKYGKPILDRFVTQDLSLELAARCALVSMDSTMRSNITVGPPVELLTYVSGSGRFSKQLSFEADNAYLQELRSAWHAGLKQAFEKLPSPPGLKPSFRLVDVKAD